FDEWSKPDGVLINSSIAAQTERSCQNLAAVLKEVGLSMSRVVKCNIFLSDIGHFAEMNSVYATYFPHKPARSCVAVKTLPKDSDVEIGCVALP
ncbi:unnamed protein product, partial [Clonostachys byssicola]